MNTKNIMSVVGSVFTAISLTSCMVDIPVPMGGGGGGHYPGPQGPVYQQQQRPYYGRPSPYYQDGGQSQQYRGRRTGPSGPRTFYGNEGMPQTYIGGFGQPPPIQYRPLP